MQSRLKFLKMWKLIQRENAVRFMMISLFSFIATVTLVRSFLALTGYPQIGSGTLHIAHVLWGGLVLYIAAILPLIYLNPRVHLFEAILSGVGVGLFIDEVGKFITRQYDYFFAAAAPIIYVFFLLVVILVIMIRRPREVDGRAELVQALETMREHLYRPLEHGERMHLEQDLGKVLETDPDMLHQDVARHLIELLHSDLRTVPDRRPAWWLRIGERSERWLTEKRLRGLSSVGMGLLGLITLKNPLQAWLEHILPNSALVIFLHTHAGRQIAPIESPVLFNVRLGLEVLVGILLLVSTNLLVMGKKRQAFDLGFFCLLVSLAVLDMLLFYFEQFSTVLIVGYQFLVLLGVMHYRRKYLKSSN
jgi:hypothetical protein